MAGARDFLAKPPLIEDLISAIQRAAEFAFKAREKMAAPASVLAAMGAAAKAASNPIRSGGHILTVFSPRGGIGSTLVASNLAICLQPDESRVALVDGNLQYGDLPVFFNVVAKNTIVDLAPRVAELEPELVETVTIAHSSGVRILAPPRPERAELVAGPHFSQLMQYLAQMYPYVLVDANHRLNEITLATLDTSDLVLLVVSQDVPAIYRMRRFMDMAPIMNLDPRRLMLVVNQYDRRIRITPEKLGETFQLEIGGVLPLDREVVIPSVNRGVPYMMQKENLARPIGRATQALATAVRKRLAKLDQAPQE
jgi:pilus assembly protein CpaE